MSDSVIAAKKTYHVTEAVALNWIAKMSKNKGYRIRSDPVYSKKYSSWIVYYMKKEMIK